MKCAVLFCAVPLIMALSCEEVDHSGENEKRSVEISPDEVARIFSRLPIMNEQMVEVYDAVSSSSGNGYDEEYTMSDLFSAPGSGVGESMETRAINTGSYVRPLRDLLSEYFAGTKASDGGPFTPQQYLDALEDSGYQLYWPYSEKWDGETMPVITFDPGDGSDANIGYEMAVDDEGKRLVREVVVDEEMASTRPVWVVNRNTDSRYESVETMRKRNPDWVTGGGEIIIRPSSSPSPSPAGGNIRSLVMRDFKMLRNYDCWFAGASEFFIKCGSVENFSASTEAELKLYSPEITDFMLVVRRNQVGQAVPLNTVLVSEWTDQLENVAFMVTEDDGGTRTDWKCSATVKVKSKSYGFDVSLPFNTRDDIVWRGQLSSQYIEKYDGITGRFGDVEITFSFLVR